ncbi:alpha-aspartyl dipeptidase peptidase E [Nonlabens tegetincola]|uniref:Alpha-aspartyl dipeptidase peptidase E n=1 Tax=Nonlabens tegetincola TaxID=323273 RepID=A0A090PXJ2_9FLAO|nr:dipeptidase PepE [Nonlabens tegetincola]GAK95554.1 alpha-aspartyl dipeptidase peptidase E [Nonlabens tegetincola]
MRNLIIASTSTIHGSGYLEYIKEDVLTALKEVGATSLLFIPFARPGGITHEEYTKKVQVALEGAGIKVVGLHEMQDPKQAILEAKAIFTGGGNTFVLLHELYKRDVLTALRKAIFSGTFYLGTSAGSNLCGLTVNNTNDMPIVHPPSLKALGVIGYNINPHYLDPVSGSTHMGETRETRINEFHTYHHIPVVGLREGSYIRVLGDKELLKGELTARVFKKDNKPVEVSPDFDFATLN